MFRSTSLFVSVSITRFRPDLWLRRFYELSAEQGSASSELRLGDYAYYGVLADGHGEFPYGGADVGISSWSGRVASDLR